MPPRFDSQANDQLRARRAFQQEASSGIAHVHYAETPAGTINGINRIFTLANVPTPAVMLCVFKNGLLQIAAAGSDYQLAAGTVTFEAGNTPQTGDVLWATYIVTT